MVSMLMEEIVIVAGGLGIRLEEIHQEIPKTLLELENKTILDHIVSTIDVCLRGDFRLFISVGIHYETMVDYVESQGHLYDNVVVVKSEDWQDGNAATLLACDGLLSNEEFILQMSDHLFSPATYRKCVVTDTVNTPYVCAQYRNEGIPDYLDLADATKILSEKNHRLVKIGKNISQWNMIDMGIFKLTQDAFEIIADLPKDKRSLSEYVHKQSSRERGFYVKPVEGAIWKDIDTPTDLHWAAELLEEGYWA